MALAAAARHCAASSLRIRRLPSFAGPGGVSLLLWSLLGCCWKLRDGAGLTSCADAACQLPGCRRHAVLRPLGGSVVWYRRLAVPAWLSLQVQQAVPRAPSVVQHAHATATAVPRWPGHIRGEYQRSSRLVRPHQGGSRVWQGRAHTGVTTVPAAVACHFSHRLGCSTKPHKARRQQPQQAAPPEQSR